MNILVIGGTRFVGRHFVTAALARGHEITLFNRGQSDDSLFPEVEHLHGDRDGDLGALAGRRWDAVVDTCGYVPRIVRQSAELLKDAVDRYLFISTISVYDNPAEPGADEDDAAANPQRRDCRGSQRRDLRRLESPLRAGRPAALRRSHLP